MNKVNNEQATCKGEQESSRPVLCKVRRGFKSDRRRNETYERRTRTNNCKQLTWGGGEETGKDVGSGDEKRNV